MIYVVEVYKGNEKQYILKNVIFDKNYVNHVIEIKELTVEQMESLIEELYKLLGKQLYGKPRTTLEMLDIDLSIVISQRKFVHYFYYQGFAILDNIKLTKDDMLVN